MSRAAKVWWQAVRDELFRDISFEPASDSEPLKIKQSRCETARSLMTIIAFLLFRNGISVIYDLRITTGGVTGLQGQELTFGHEPSQEIVKSVKSEQWLRPTCVDLEACLMHAMIIMRCWYCYKLWYIYNLPKFSRIPAGTLLKMLLTSSTALAHHHRYSLPSPLSDS